MKSRWVASAFGAAAIVLAGCGGSSGSSASGDDLYQYFTTENDGQDIKSMCDADSTQWQCFYDHFDTSHDSRVDIYLSTPGDVDDSAVSESARTWVKNMLAAGDNPPVHPSNIVSFVNGVDSGTTQAN